MRGPLTRLCRALRRGGADDGGFAALELTLGAAFLLLPIFLLVASVPTWSERHGMARLAAQEAARVVAVEPDNVGADGRARGLAEQIARNHGTELLSVAIDREIAGDADGLGTAQTFVVARVEVRMPALPFVGGAVPGFHHTVIHREPIDLYRSRP